MDRDFGDDVGVETVAEIDRVDVVARKRIESAGCKRLSGEVAGRGAVGRRSLRSRVIRGWKTRTIPSRCT